MPTNSIDIWLKRGKKVNVGGRDLLLMPLPITKLFAVAHWLEENCTDVIREQAEETEPGKIPHPLALVTRVLGRVNMNELILDIFTFPKDPNTKQPINKDLDIEFFETYLDIPTAHMLVQEFVVLNDIPNLIKNLQSLPVMRKLMEVAQITFGIPYLNSLQLSTDTPQTKPEGSLSLKSTDSLMHSTIAEQVFGEETSSKLVQ